ALHHTLTLPDATSAGCKCCNTPQSTAKVATPNRRSPECCAARDFVVRYIASCHAGTSEEQVEIRRRTREGQGECRRGRRGPAGQARFVPGWREDSVKGRRTGCLPLLPKTTTVPTDEVAIA